MLADLQLIIPELVLAFGAMLVLMAGVYTNDNDKAIILSTRLSSMVLLGALFAILTAPMTQGVIFSGLYKLDNFATFVKAILVFSAAIVMILSFQFVEDKANKLGFEYPILILLSLLGMLIMVSSNDLLTLYLGLELQSLSLYILAAIKREEKRSTEAAVKYFVLGALASGILLYGISLLYGFIGSTNFDTIREVLLATHAELSKGIIVGLVFVIIGFCFKISAAPFHMWTPDVYEGVPTPVTAYFAIVPKLAAMSLFIRVLVDGPFSMWAFQWQQIIIVIAVLSMFVGALGGIWQNNIKRLLAYSSIGHMGYGFLGLVANNIYGVQTIIVYFVIYILTSIALFTILLSVKTRRQGEESMIENIDHLKGFAKRQPILAIIISLIMFSLIGLPFPPFAGFFGKFFIFSAAIQTGHFALAVIGMVASVIAAYYYLRIIKVMYFDKPDDETRIVLTFNQSSVFILAIVSILSFLIFIMPDKLVDAAETAAIGPAQVK